MYDFHLDFEGTAISNLDQNLASCNGDITDPLPPPKRTGYTQGAAQGAALAVIARKAHRPILQVWRKMLCA